MWWLHNGCLVDYPYFEQCYKLIATDLSKQHKLDAGSKEINWINFTGNLIRAEGTTIISITKEVKETAIDFSKRTVKVLWFYFILI